MRTTRCAPSTKIWIKISHKTQFILPIKNGAEAFEETINSAITQGLELVASYSFSNGHGPVRLLLVENASVARNLLNLAAIPHREEPILLVEAAPRIPAILHLNLELQRAQVGVLYSYALPAEDDRLMVVFKTQDDDVALRAMLGEQEEVFEEQLQVAGIQSP